MIKKIIFSITFFIYLFSVRAADITFYINSKDCISYMLTVDKIIKENHYRSFQVISDNIKSVKEDFKSILQKYPKTSLVFSFDEEQAKKYKSYVSSLIIYSKKTNLEVLNIPLIFANQVTNLLHLYLDDINIKDTIMYEKFLPKTINGAIHYLYGNCIYKVGAKNTGEKVIEIPDNSEVLNLVSEILSHENNELKKINYIYEDVFNLYGAYLKNRLDLINFYLDENGNVFYLMNLKYVDVKILTVESKLDTTFVVSGQLLIIKQNIESNSLSRYYIKDSYLIKNQYFINERIGFMVFKDIFYFFISPTYYNPDRKFNYIAKAKLVNAILDVNEIDSNAIYPDCYKNYYYRFGGSGFDNNMHYFYNTTQIYYPVQKRTDNVLFPDSLVEKINNSTYEDFFSNPDDLKRLMYIVSIIHIYPAHKLIIFTYNGNEYIGFIRNNKMIEAKFLAALNPKYKGWHKMINLANGQLLFFDIKE